MTTFLIKEKLIQKLKPRPDNSKPKMKLLNKEPRPDNSKPKMKLFVVKPKRISTTKPNLKKFNNIVNFKHPSKSTKEKKNVLQKSSLNLFFNTFKNSSNPLQSLELKKKKIFGKPKRMSSILRQRHSTLRPTNWLNINKNRLNKFFSPKSKRRYLTQKNIATPVVITKNNKLVVAKYTNTNSFKSFRPFFIFDSLNSDNIHKKITNLKNAKFFWLKLLSQHLNNSTSSELTSTFNQILQQISTTYFKYENELLQSFYKDLYLPINYVLFTQPSSTNTQLTNFYLPLEKRLNDSFFGKLLPRLNFLVRYSNSQITDSTSFFVPAILNAGTLLSERYSQFLNKWSLLNHMNFYIKSKRLTKIANINLKKKRHQYHAFYSYYLNPSFKKALSTRIHIPDRRTVGREGVWSYFPEQLRRKNLFSIWPRYANFFHQSFEVKKPRITPALFRNKQYNVKLTLNCSRSLLLNKTGKINRNFTKSPINHLILNVFKHARFNRNDERSYQSYRTKKLLPSLKKKETKKSKRRKLFRFRSARRKSTNLFLSALTLWKKFSYSNHTLNFESKRRRFAKKPQFIQILKKANYLPLATKTKLRTNDVLAARSNSLQKLSSVFKRSKLRDNTNAYSIQNNTKLSLNSKLLAKISSFKNNHKYVKSKPLNAITIRKLPKNFNKLFRSKKKLLIRKLKNKSPIRRYGRYWYRALTKQTRRRLNKLIGNRKWLTRQLVRRLALKSNLSFTIWRFESIKLNKNKQHIAPEPKLNNKLFDEFNSFLKKFNISISDSQFTLRKALFKNTNDLFHFSNYMPTTFFQKSTKSNISAVNPYYNVINMKKNLSVHSLSLPTLSQEIQHSSVLKFFLLKLCFNSSLSLMNSELSNPNFVFNSLQAFVFQSQNQLKSFFEKAWTCRYDKSNLWIVPISNYVIRKKIVQAAALHAFSLNLSLWYYKTLIQFIENCTGRKTLLHFGPFLEKVLSFEDQARCSMWNQRVGGFQRIVGHRIFVYEALKVVAMAIRLKDPTFLSNWIRAMLYRMSFWKYRVLFRYLKFIFRHIFMANSEYFNLRGIKLQLKGKISVAGNARTRRLVLQFGNTSHSQFDNKIAYDLSFVHTFTGILGFKLWFFY